MEVLNLPDKENPLINNLKNSRKWWIRMGMDHHAAERHYHRT